MEFESDDAAAMFPLKEVKASAEEHSRRGWAHGA
jgi:hypothetical protein